MKHILILFTLVLTQASAAAPAKKATKAKAPTEATTPLLLKSGSRWALSKNLTLRKTGLTPEEFIPYINIWSLKTHEFMTSSSSSVDSCEFRTAISKKATRQPTLKVNKLAEFHIANIQETTMSILFDMVSRDARKSEVEQIQVTCSSYETGLDSPGAKAKFKKHLEGSLAAIFTTKK